MEEEVDYDMPEEEEEQADDAGAPEPDDIYGDLYTDQGEGGGLLHLQNSELRDRTAHQQQIIDDLRQQVEQLTEERDQLQSEKGTLLRNISCLFKTAQLELERKEGELRELRRLEIQRVSARSPPRDMHRPARQPVRQPEFPYRDQFPVTGEMLPPPPPLPIPGGA